MTLSFLLNMPLTCIMALTYVFHIRSVDNVLGSTYPFVALFQDVYRTPAATAGFTVAVLVLMVMVTMSSMASTSRQLFAFAWVSPGVQV